MSIAENKQLASEFFARFSENDIADEPITPSPSPITLPKSRSSSDLPSTEEVIFFVKSLSQPGNPAISNPFIGSTP